MDKVEKDVSLEDLSIMIIKKYYQFILKIFLERKILKLLVLLALKTATRHDGLSSTAKY